MESWESQFSSNKGSQQEGEWELVEIDFVLSAGFPIPPRYHSIPVWWFLPTSRRLWKPHALFARIEWRTVLRKTSSASSAEIPNHRKSNSSEQAIITHTSPFFSMLTAGSRRESAEDCVLMAIQEQTRIHACDYHTQLLGLSSPHTILAEFITYNHWAVW